MAPSQILLYPSMGRFSRLNIVIYLHIGERSMMLPGDASRTMAGITRLTNAKIEELTSQRYPSM